MKKRLAQLGCLWLLFGCAGFAVAQERLLVGPYDPAYVNSLVLSASPNPNAFENDRASEPGFFGLRLLVYRQGETLEETPPLERVALFGPHAADGAYARLHWELPFERKLATLQWARIGPRTVIGKFSTPTRVRLALETYQPFARPNEPHRVNFRAQDVRTLLGEQVGQLSPQSKPLRLLVRAERNADGAASYNDAALMRTTLVKEGRALLPQADSNAVFGLHRFGALSFELNEKESLSFVLLLGEDLAALEREAEQVLREPLAKQMDQAESRYETARPRSEGWLSDALESLSRTVNWNRLFLPELRSEFAAAWRSPTLEKTGLPAQRMNIHWDAFFRALTASLVDPPQANATVRTLLARQSNDGRLSPSTVTFRPTGTETTILHGRSMPPVGALCAWKIYLATQDVTYLTAVYPRLKRWHEWWLADRGDGQAWRDGNGDGLLEWGYDAELEVGEISARQMPVLLKQQFAAAESGLDDSPQWQLEAKPEPGKNEADLPSAELVKTTPLFNEKTHTLELTPVGLNALYALEIEVLHAMARELGLREDVTKWEEQYLQLKKLLDEKLWSETDKLYLNRRWNGEFGQRLTPEIFYVLAAGIPSRERAAQILETLRDPKKFGGAPLLPTLARDDVAFTQTGHWRGRVSALTNYLVYLGLKRYGFYEEAADLARQSTQLVREAWWQEAKVYDNFASVPQELPEVLSPPTAALEVWFGGLMWLPGLEELLALDPWAGLTIGNEAVSDEARLSNLPLGGNLYNIAIASQQLTIQRNGQAELELDAPIRLFNYRSNERTLSFFSETSKSVDVRVPAVEGRTISVSLDGKLIGSSQPGKAARFKLTPGVHRVVIVK